MKNLKTLILFISILGLILCCVVTRLMNIRDMHRQVKMIQTLDLHLQGLQKVDHCLQEALAHYETNDFAGGRVWMETVETELARIKSLPILP